MHKPKVTVNPIANQHSAPNERIIEFSGEGGGGLVSLRIVCRPDGTTGLDVHVYRQDQSVSVTVSKERADGFDNVPAMEG